MIDKLQGSLLRHRMVESVMAVLIPEDSVPRGPQRANAAGVACAVGHEADNDRLIVDRRPQNACEMRFRWAKLPRGSMFAQFRLR